MSNVDDRLSEKSRRYEGLEQSGGLRKLPSGLVPSPTITPPPILTPSPATPVNPESSPAEQAGEGKELVTRPQVSITVSRESRFGRTGMGIADLARQVRSYNYSEDGTSVNLLIRREAYERLASASSELFVPRKTLLTYLLDTFLPKPTRAYMAPDAPVGADLALRKELFTQEYQLPKWLNSYLEGLVGEIVRRDRSVSIMAGPYLRWKLAEVGNHVIKVEAIEAVLMHALPEATLTLQPHRRARLRQ